jgi:hypothetical protein
MHCGYVHVGGSSQVPDLDGEYMTVHQARALLHVSRYKMSRLIGEHVLKTKPYMLDRRIKLVKRRDVEKLADSIQRLRDGMPPQ